jgi:hypothetical protein
VYHLFRQVFRQKDAPIYKLSHDKNIYILEHIGSWHMDSDGILTIGLLGVGAYAVYSLLNDKGVQDVTTSAGTIAKDASSIIHDTVTNTREIFHDAPKYASNASNDRENFQNAFFPKIYPIKQNVQDIVKDASPEQKAKFYETIYGTKSNPIPATIAWNQNKPNIFRKGIVSMLDPFGILLNIGDKLTGSSSILPSAYAAPYVAPLATNATSSNAPMFSKKSSSSRSSSSGGFGRTVTTGGKAYKVSSGGKLSWA